MVHFMMFVLAVAPGAVTDGDRGSRAARLDAVKADVATADAEVAAARARLGDPNHEDAELERLRGAAAERHRAGFADAMRVATEDPSSDVAFEALSWVLQHAPEVYRVAEGKAALEMVARFHAADPRVGAAVARVAHYPPFGFPGDDKRAEAAYRPAMDLFDAVLRHNPDRTARGQAAIGMAWQALRARGAALAKKAPDEERLRLEAVARFEAVVKGYGDCPYLDGNKQTPTLGDRARQELFELRNLQPGQLAPEIVGGDVEGRHLRLGDYRGKVVMLVFWAAWCAPCMAEVPHEREIVERLRGRPFVMIGVNGDDDVATALRAMEKRGISWRSFWNGPDGPWGTISMEWNVRTWPRVYVIDAKGVIRENGLTGSELDAPLEKWVAEAEAAAAGKGG